MISRILHSVLALALLLYPIVADASLAVIYYAQAAAGTGLGTDCSNPIAVHDVTNGFNVAGKWGVGATQIGQDTIVHYCSVYNGTAGEADVFFFQAGGASGHPITLIFDSGAKLSSPVWASFTGAPITNHQNWIIIDGGTNGIIENTDNGTGLGHNQNSGAIYSDGSNVIIRNWHINNLCRHTLTSDLTGCGTSGSNPFAIQWAGSNNTITNNVCDYTYSCVHMSQGTTDTGNVVSNNTATHMNWGVSVGLNSTSNSGTLDIFGNDISIAVNWDDTGTGCGGTPCFHHNGIFLFQGTGGAESGVTRIYNNRIHGDMGIYDTSFIFIDPNGGTVTNVTEFNNLLDNTGSTNGPANGFITGLGTGSGAAYNNTIYCNGQGQSAMKIDNAGSTIKNNIVQGCQIGLFVNPGSSITASDKNVFFGLTGSGGCSGCTMSYNGTNYATVAAWTVGTTFDATSSIADPKLNAGSSPPLQLQSGSSAIGLGADLTGLGITPLNSDYLAVARPNGSAWASGAFQYIGGGGSTPPSSGHPVISLKEGIQ